MLTEQINNTTTKSQFKRFPVGPQWAIEGSQYFTGTRKIVDKSWSIRAMSYMLYKRFPLLTPKQKAKKIEGAFELQRIGVSEGLRSEILACCEWIAPKYKRARPEPIKRSAKELEEIEERQQAGNERKSSKVQATIWAALKNYFQEHNQIPTIKYLKEITGACYLSIKKALNYFKVTTSNDPLVNQLKQVFRTRTYTKHINNNGNTSGQIDDVTLKNESNFQKFIRLYQELGCNSYAKANEPKPKHVACKYCNEMVWFNPLGFGSWEVKEVSTRKIHNCKRLHLVKGHKAAAPPDPNQLKTPDGENLIEKIQRMIFSVKIKSDPQRVKT